MNDNYATPKWLKKCFINYFDPCPLNENPNINGLKLDWKEFTYVNPPYSDPLPWVIKAIIEMNKGNIVIMLLRCDPSTKVWKLCHTYGEILYFGRRIKFNGKTPYFSSMLVIFSKK